MFLHNRRVHAPDIESYELLLVDPEAQAAAALREQFVRSRRPAPRWLAGLGEAAAEGVHGVDAVIFDLHAGREGQLDECLRLKREQPALPLIALSAPGPALRRVHAWNDEHHALDEILAKPLVPEALFRAVGMLVRERRSARSAARLAGLVAEGGRDWSGAPVMLEAAVLFTDVRRSTALAGSLPAPALFDALNVSLSAHAMLVRRWRGSVVKFTGDGLLATFRGRGRAHFALRCALDLQARFPATSEMPIGIGVAEGLVMQGMLGEPGNQLFDVIGATVHLAARLCGSAGEGEVVVPPRLLRSAGLPISRHRTEAVHLRGFDKLFECVFIAPPRP